MLDDAEKKLRPFIQQLLEDQACVDVGILDQLSQFCTGRYFDREFTILKFSSAIAAQDFTDGGKVIANLMKMGFSKNSSENQWVLGLKRTIDILK